MTGARRPVPEHTVAVAVAAGGVVLLELAWARTGLFRRGSYWIAMAICFGFQALVEGFLTRRGAAVFRFSPRHVLGPRWPGDVPVEDWAYSFSLMTLTLVLWQRRVGDPPPHRRGPLASVGR